jgi:hypothetical protein
MRWLVWVAMHLRIGYGCSIPIFLERIILPALATLLIMVAVSNQFSRSVQDRIKGSVLVLALSYAVSWTLHQYNRKKVLISSTGNGHKTATLLRPEPISPATVPATGSDGRIIFTIRPEQLIKMCDGLITVEADRMMAPYVGKWINVAGSVNDVTAFGEFSRLSLDVPVGSLGDSIRANMMFNWKAQGDRMSLLRKGDQISASGKINSVTGRVFHAVDSELIAVE